MVLGAAVGRKTAQNAFCGRLKSSIEKKVVDDKKNFMGLISITNKSAIGREDIFDSRVSFK